MNSPGIEIRRARRADVAAWQNAVDALLSQTQPGGAELEAALDDDACYAWLAIAANQPVGLVAAYRLPGLSAHGPLVYLYDIAVSAGHRGRGIGRALLDALLEQCRRDGVPLVWAGSGVDNGAARALFEKSGALATRERFVEYEWRLGR